MELKKVMETLAINPKYIQKLSYGAFEAIKQYNMIDYIERVINSYNACR